MTPDSFTLANASCDRMRKNVDEMLAEVRASRERVDAMLKETVEKCNAIGVRVKS
jgi:hypothetical protein